MPFGVSLYRRRHSADQVPDFRDIALAGARALVVEPGCLRIFNLQMPQQVPETGCLHWIGGEGVAYRDGLACVVGEKLWTLSLGGSGAPVLLGELDLGVSLVQVRLVGFRAFVATGTEGLYIVDISSPKTPRELSRLKLPGRAVDLCASADRVLLVAGDGGLQIIDVASPTAPVLLGAVQFEGEALAVDTGNGNAYIATGRYGLRVVDISDPLHPRDSGAPAAGRQVVAVKARENDVIVLEAGHGLKFFDTGDPQYLRFLRFLPLRGARGRFQVDDIYAYLADGRNGLRVVRML